MVAVKSKRYQKMTEGFDRLDVKSVEDAIKMLKERCSESNFDQTVELAFKLDIDTKQSDQLVRGSFSLPNGTGKSVRVIAFCDGEEGEAATANGAIEVGAAELADKIKAGWMDFDVAIAHPSMMRFVGALGKVLGPKGLMPSPKSGTVTPKVGQAVKEFSAGKIEFRNDKEGNVHMITGKLSFEEDKLVENVNAAIKYIVSLRPITCKGDFVKNISVSTTMGLGIKVQIPV